MKLQIELTLTEELLGTVAGDPAVAETYIIDKAATPEQRAEEAATVPDVKEEIEKATTRFHRTPEGNPFIYDYQIKGFFKDACSSLARADGTLSSKLRAYKKVIDGTIFVEPRQIMLKLPAGGELGICQRPLRAQTAQGERIALARSETVPAGTRLAFTVVLLSDKIEGLATEWFEYGTLRGLGQWRNSGKGRFQAKIGSPE